MSAGPSVLELVTIPIPCPVSWDEMPGTDRVRFCLDCRQHVYNLSDMTRAEAEALVRDREGRRCVRFFRRPDGTVLTRDCLRLREHAGRFAARALAAIVGFILGVYAFIGIQVTADRGGSKDPRDIKPVRTILEWLDPQPQVNSQPQANPQPPGTPKCREFLGEIK